MFATRPSPDWFCRRKQPISWALRALKTELHAPSSSIMSRPANSPCMPIAAPMKAKATTLMLADLGVTKSHSRPYTSNDNPFSESHFKTLKYQPQFPQRFGCIEDAKTFCRSFFDWYNQDHHHAGIGLMTPDQVHYGQTDEVYAACQKTLDRAFQSNPERFVKKPPEPPLKPTAAWINPPTQRLGIQA
jgi:putative transposase